MTPEDTKPSTVDPSTASASEQKLHGLEMDRIFSQADVHSFDELNWEKRRASITDASGTVIFEQDEVEVPEDWSQLATNIIASKYLYGEQDTSEREHSLKQLVHRVTRTIADWGRRDGYFASDAAADVFYDELTWLCVNQYGAFNSPVWFNCGLWEQYRIGADSGPGAYYVDTADAKAKRAPSQYEYPQCAACFIQSVEDTMDGVMQLASSEAMLFKYGSGTGTDLSSIRSTHEKLSGGGTPSGPLSFLRIYDAIAGAVKSGGKTRRAAKMNTLKCQHPDILAFIEAKSHEEKKAWALIEQGYAADFNGEAYGSVCFQNENLSVRITDAFMKAVEDDADWSTCWVTDPDVAGPTHKARDLMKGIADGTWICGDPGVQFEDTIQRWHTCKTSGRINSSNPCSEYMFLDDSACNLASLNLMKFRQDDGTFEVDRFKSAVNIFLTAQEIIVDRASYPTALIAENSHRFRPLGLGYANLGALLMAEGLPYDSEGGRGLAGAITAIMHLQAYTHSARLAEARGSFKAFEPNRESMLEVISMHREAVEDLPATCPASLLDAARHCGDQALALGERFGFRNAQVTVLAPTGTIGFMMDCDTTGVEPDIALVKYKTLAGGGMLKIVNQTVPQALKQLGYTPKQIAAILEHIEENDTIEGSPELAERDLPIFDCAFKPRMGERFIPYLGHLRMMAAVQPFLSGAISKTVNMPEEATREQIMETYREGWLLGLKALAIYRDGCKRSQPVNAGKSEASSPTVAGEGEGPRRKRLPDTRQSLTHKFNVGGHEGYLTVGLYEDGRPGEVFITMAKEGSTIGGLMNCFGTAVSVCLQYGVPLDTLVKKFAHTRFDPSGWTGNKAIPMAKSPMDYIFRWLSQTFLETPSTDAAVQEETPEVAKAVQTLDDQFSHFMEDAPACDQCGAITVRNGSCYRCFNCGASMGCS